MCPPGPDCYAKRTGDLQQAAGLRHLSTVQHSSRCTVSYSSRRTCCASATSCQAPNTCTIARVCRPLARYLDAHAPHTRACTTYHQSQLARRGGKQQAEHRHTASPAHVMFAPRGRLLRLHPSGSHVRRQHRAYLNSRRSATWCFQPPNALAASCISPGEAASRKGGRAAAVAGAADCTSPHATPRPAVAAASPAPAHGAPADRGDGDGDCDCVCNLSRNALTASVAGDGSGASLASPDCGCCWRRVLLLLVAAASRDRPPADQRGEKAPSSASESPGACNAWLPSAPTHPPAANIAPAPPGTPVAQRPGSPAAGAAGATAPEPGGCGEVRCARAMRARSGHRATCCASSSSRAAMALAAASKAV